MLLNQQEYREQPCFHLLKATERHSKVEHKADAGAPAGLRFVMFGAVFDAHAGSPFDAMPRAHERSADITGEQILGKVMRDPANPVVDGCAPCVLADHPAFEVDMHVALAVLGNLEVDPRTVAH